MSKHSDHIIASKQVSRRTVLKGSALAGAAVLGAPFIVKNAFASSGELNFMGWADYPFEPIFAAFTAKTGIKVNFNPQPDQDTMAALAKAGAGKIDIGEPTADRVENWIEQGFLRSWDESKINLDGVEPGILASVAGKQSVINGERFAVPSVWGSEGLTFVRDKAKVENGKTSLGELWNPEYAGAVTVRPHSGLMTIGRWLDGEGKLPHPYIDSFKSEDAMVANYNVIMETALKVKANVAQWWTNENEAQGAFRSNGCVIGHCWDTSAFKMVKEGLNVGYAAPKEGIAGWMQNFVLMKDAKNVEQAHAWVAWLNSPEGSAQWAQAIGGNPIAKGAAQHMADATVYNKFYNETFTEDVLKNVWWWPAQTTWFVNKRNEYADKFKSA